MKIDKAVVGGFVRHLLTVAGGGFVSSGTLTAADLEIAVGAVLAIAGVVWSALEKRRAT